MRRERRGQVDVDQVAVGGAPARRGRWHLLRGREGRAQPSPRAGAGDPDHLPGAHRLRQPQRHGEHLHGAGDGEERVPRPARDAPAVGGGPPVSEVRPQPRDHHGPPLQRPAKDGGDRQGAGVQAEGHHPRRADRLLLGGGDRQPPRDHPHREGERDRNHLHLAPPRGSVPNRRPGHRPPRRAQGEPLRHPGAHQGPAHQGHGGPGSLHLLPAGDRAHRRGGVRGPQRERERCPERLLRNCGGARCSGSPA